MIYLDNCATTKPRDEVVEMMVKMLKTDFANPSSLHRLGMNAEKIRESARDELAKFINCDPREIIFTSGGTESNNIAVHGFIEKNKRLKKIITTAIEHASLRDLFLHYKKLGYEVVLLPVDNGGKVDLNEIQKIVDENTALVALAHVNNEIGTIQDIEEISRIVKSKNKNTFLHVDGVQALGKIPVDVKSLGVDSYAVSSHKIYGPKGTGALYLKDAVLIDPIVIGGGQEKSIRSGTENMPGIAGFKVAVEIENKNFKNEYENAKMIKAYLLEKLEENLDRYRINGTDTSPYITSISIEGTRGEVLLHYLEDFEIYISTQSACSSNGTHKSHVLEAIELPKKYFEGTIRICISKDITREDIDEFVDKLKYSVKEVRGVMER